MFLAEENFLGRQVNVLKSSQLAFKLNFIKLTILARKHVIKHNRSDFLERDFLIINNISNKMNVRNIGINEKIFGIKFNISREII